MKSVLECGSSRAGQCVLFPGACSHLQPGNCSVLCKGWVLVSLTPMVRYGKDWLQFASCIFFLHRMCQWVGLQLWEHNKGLFFRRLRQINQRAFLSVRNYSIKGTVLTRDNL